MVSIGDTYFIAEDYKNAEFYLDDVIEYADNPFIFLKGGQTKYYLGDIELAKEYLAKAYDLGGKEFFEGEAFFLELAKTYQPKQNVVYEFENMFRLPLEYQFLEKEYLSYEYLWSPINLPEIYALYTVFFEKIPEELYSNSISFLCVSAILEAAIHLQKTEEFSKWLEYIKLTSVKRYDVGVIEVWQGICEIYKNNEQKAMMYFKQAVDKGEVRILKDFRHFGNDIYDYYKQRCKKYN